MLAVRVLGRGNRDELTYRKNEAVLKVGKLFVALLAAEHAVLLVHHFLVAVLAGTGLVEAVLFAQVHYGCYAGVVICLKGEMRKKVKTSTSSVPCVETCRLMRDLK